MLAAGLSPLEAVSLRSPGMVPIFGWPEAVADVEAVRGRWEDAEAGTDRAMARRLEVLDEAERSELAEVAAAVLDAVR